MQLFSVTLVQLLMHLRFFSAASSSVAAATSSTKRLREYRQLDAHRRRRRRRLGTVAAAVVVNRASLLAVQAGSHSVSQSVSRANRQGVKQVINS